MCRLPVPGLPDGRDGAAQHEAAADGLVLGGLLMTTDTRGISALLLQRQLASAGTKRRGCCATSCGAPWSMWRASRCMGRWKSTTPGAGAPSPACGRVGNSKGARPPLCWSPPKNGAAARARSHSWRASCRPARRISTLRTPSRCRAGGVRMSPPYQRHPVSTSTRRSRPAAGCCIATGTMRRAQRCL